MLLFTASSAWTHTAPDRRAACIESLQGPLYRQTVRRHVAPRSLSSALPACVGSHKGHYDCALGACCIVAGGLAVPAARARRLLARAPAHRGRGAAGAPG